MKKSIMIILSLFFCSASLHAVEQELVCRIGTSYAQDLENSGLDLSVFYSFNFDPYFAAGFEGTFFWVPWDKKVGTKDVAGFDVDVVTSTNTYAIPIMATGQVRLPFLIKKIYVEPNFTFGIGYTPVVLDYDRPAYEDTVIGTVSAKHITRFYHGFSWQVLVGASLQPSAASRIKFVANLGYRGINARRDEEKLDISGVLFRVGVLFKLK